MDGIFNVYVWEIARGKSSMTTGFTAFYARVESGVALLPLKKNKQKKKTLGWCIKGAVMLKLLTEHEENQTISIYFPPPSFFPLSCTQTENTPVGPRTKKQMNPASTKAVW